MRHAFTALVLLGVVGCGGTKYAPVSGRVTLDGQPLTDAVVIFQPIGDPRDPGGPGSAAKTNANGEYTLKVVGPGDRAGALVGKHQVRISTRTSSASPSDESANQTPERVPAKYVRDPLTFEVPAEGTGTAHFDLTSE
ncbi:MAG: DUF4198 domain-containing protein [Gemmataceae bacterium]|nr:DUF4198 domain-containing protein [Gemmataceae bacterium]